MIIWSVRHPCLHLSGGLFNHRGVTHEQAINLASRQCAATLSIPARLFQIRHQRAKRVLRDQLLPPAITREV